MLDTDSYWGLSLRHKWQKQEPMVAALPSTVVSRKATQEFTGKTGMYTFMAIGYVTKFLTL